MLPVSHCILIHIAARRAACEICILHGLMIVKKAGFGIKHGMLIDWNLCKVTEPSATLGIGACIVSTIFEVPYLLSPNVSRHALVGALGRTLLFLLDRLGDQI
jgi:hypothetical protein